MRNEKILREKTRRAQHYELQRTGFVSCKNFVVGMLSLLEMVSGHEIISHPKSFLRPVLSSDDKTRAVKSTPNSKVL